MKNPVLMSNAEPTDIELINLMHEVASEAKQKASLIQQQLSEKVKQLIIKSTEK